MTIYSMAFFSCSWCVWCLRTFHQLCHQVVFPKWRAGVLQLPAVIYLSFWKPDCSIYPCRGHYQRAFCSICLQCDMTVLFPLCPCSEQRDLPMQITCPQLGNGDNSVTSETPGGFPRHNSHWADLCLHIFVKINMENISVSTIHTFKNMPTGLIFNIFQDSAQKQLKPHLCNQNQCNIEVIIVKPKTIGWCISSSDGLIHQQEIQKVLILRYIKKIRNFWCSESTRYNERVNLNKHPSFLVLENHLLLPLTTHWEKNPTKTHRGILDKK